MIWIGDLVPKVMRIMAARCEHAAIMARRDRVRRRKAGEDVPVVHDWRLNIRDTLDLATLFALRLPRATSHRVTIASSISHPRDRFTRCAGRSI